MAFFFVLCLFPQFDKNSKWERFYCVIRGLRVGVTLFCNFIAMKDCSYLAIYTLIMWWCGEKQMRESVTLFVSYQTYFKISNQARKNSRFNVLIVPPLLPFATANTNELIRKVQFRLISNATAVSLLSAHGWLSPCCHIRFCWFFATFIIRFCFAICSVIATKCLRHMVPDKWSWREESS